MDLGVITFQVILVQKIMKTEDTLGHIQTSSKSSNRTCLPWTTMLNQLHLLWHSMPNRSFKTIHSILAAKQHALTRSKIHLQTVVQLEFNKTSRILTKCFNTDLSKSLRTFSRLVSILRLHKHLKSTRHWNAKNSTKKICICLTSSRKSYSTSNNTGTRYSWTIAKKTRRLQTPGRIWDC